MFMVYSGAASPGRVGGSGGLGDDVIMKNTKETVYNCYNSCEMFFQFDVSFWDVYLLHLGLTSFLSYL